MENKIVMNKDINEEQIPDSLLLELREKGLVDFLSQLYYKWLCDKSRTNNSEYEEVIRNKFSDYDIVEVLVPRFSVQFKFGANQVVMKCTRYKNDILTIAKLVV